MGRANLNGMHRPWVLSARFLVTLKRAPSARFRAPLKRAALVCPGALVLWGAGLLGASSASDVDAPPSAAFASITKEEVEADVRYLAAPELEGRDSPSHGLELAQQHVSACFAAAGLIPAPDSDAAWRRTLGQVDPPAWSVHGAHGTQPDGAKPDGAPTGDPAPGAPDTAGDDADERSATRALWLRPYKREKLLYDRVALAAPAPEQCALQLTLDGGEPRALRYGQDFVPLSGYTGEASGELAFAGFGIDNAEARYDDFRGLELRGKIVAIVAGEPDHKRLFDGPDVTAEASIWNKIDELANHGASGVLVIRRPPKVGRGEALPALAYRYTRASWAAPTTDRERALLPTLEVHWDAARDLLGFDALEWAQKVDRSGKPSKKTISDRHVTLRSATLSGAVPLYNVVAFLQGSDPARAGESVVVGAHLDHIGVGPRERVGLGADDNASGTAALMEVAEALALARPARSIWFVGFSAEEDGLVGSEAFVQDLPVPKERIVAMVNLDMIGRGNAKEVVVLGFQQSPGMRDAVARAERLGRTGISRVDDCSDLGLFKRSDHYSFHAAEIPTVFFFENYPLEQNKDYHTWRDVADLVDFEKVRNTARLAFLTTWVLANQSDRLPPPK